MKPKRPERIPPIKAVMTPFPWHVALDDSLADAKAMMSEHEIRHLPVTDGNELVGIVTDRDIGLVETVIGAATDRESITVRDVGVHDAYVVDLSVPLDRVLAEMAARPIDSALVVKNGRLSGIFTVTDACRSFSEFLEMIFADDSGDAA